jgi:hypothetical protein
VLGVENIDLSSIVTKVQLIFIYVFTLIFENKEIIFLKHSDYCTKMKQIIEVMDLTKVGPEKEDAR